MQTNDRKGYEPVTATKYINRGNFNWRARKHESSLAGKSEPLPSQSSTKKRVPFANNQVMTNKSESWSKGDKHV